jgi:hypothetical protein
MNDEDIKLSQYQDDLDTDPNKRDKITEEQGDNLADRAGIPQHELAHELKHLRFDESGHGSDDDRREDLEDRDENMGQAGKR